MLFFGVRLYMYIRCLLLGVGVWGAWIKMEIDGAQDIVLFLDTDAVDRVGHTEFNDDR